MKKSLSIDRNNKFLRKSSEILEHLMVIEDFRYKKHILKIH